MAGSAPPGVLSAAPGRLAASLASRADEPALRRLLRENPMGGAITVGLEREPDVFVAAEVEGHPHVMAVVRTREGRVVAMGSRAVADVFVDGAPRRLGYLGQLRVDRRFRGRLRPLADGFAALRASRADDEERYDITSIVSDNTPALRLLCSRLPGLPRYRPLEPFVTLVMTCRPARPRPLPAGLRLERGREELLPAIADCLERNNRRFQFARRWSLETLRSPVACRGLRPEDFLLARTDGHVAGCVAVWDQAAYKQVVVRGYSRGLGRWRPLLNLAAPLLGTPRLPAPGGRLRQVFLSHVAVDGDAGAVFGPLLAHALASARDKGAECLVAGFASRHPLLAVARRLGRWRAYESMLHLVQWDEPAAAPGPGIPHLEVALL